MKVAAKLEVINKKINDACLRSNRNPSEIRVIAVTKYVSTERAMEAVEAGIRDLGENRDEGLIEKRKTLQDKTEWHFIGSLQTRKVKNVIGIADYIHSLDRLSLADEINRRSSSKVKCLVQVNVSGEESKHGLLPEEAVSFIKQIMPFENISVEGLMTMAPLTDDPAILRKCFRKLRLLREDIQKLNLPHAPCTELSMGMSNDYTIAIEEGATMVRIGTALVGEED